MVIIVDIRLTGTERLRQIEFGVRLEPEEPRMACWEGPDKNESRTSQPVVMFRRASIQT